MKLINCRSPLTQILRRLRPYDPTTQFEGHQKLGRFYLRHGQETLLDGAEDMYGGVCAATLQESMVSGCTGRPHMSERTQWELSGWHLQGLNAMCQGVYKVTTADKPRVTANCPLTRLHLGLLNACVMHFTDC